MARPIRLAVPVVGLAVGVLAVAAWVAGLPWRGVDLGSAVGLVAGAALGVAAYVRGADLRTKRVAIVTIGWNAFGLAALALAYAAG